MRSIGVAVAHPDPGIVDELVHAVEASEDLYLALDPDKASVVLAGGTTLTGLAGQPVREGTAVVGLAAGRELAEVSRAALRCGAHEIVCWPQDRPALRSILRDAASRARLAARRTDGRVIAVVGARGGAGATTIAALVALAVKGVVVDLDPAGAGQSAFLADETQTTLAEILTAIDEMDDHALSGAMAPHAAGKALCVPLRSQAATPGQAARLIALLKSSASVAVCDLGRGGDEAARTVLAAADVVVCVCAPDVASLRGARALIDPAGAAMRVVLNRRERRRVRARDVARVLGAPPAAVVPADGRVRRAGEAGRLPSRGPARRAVDRFASTLVEEDADGS